MEEWRLAPLPKDEFGKECGLLGPSPGGAAASLDTSRQRIHYLIKKGYLDAVHIYEGRQLQAIMVTNESIKRFRENPNPKPGPKQKASIPEVAKWAIKSMMHDLTEWKLHSDEEVREWVNSTPEGRDFRKRARDQYGPVYDQIENKVIAAAVKLGLKKAKGK